jgi:hypothetical protein
MQAKLIGFGQLEIEGRVYDHDVVIEGGRVAKRKKKGSKHLASQYGHTPLSLEEDIPWGGQRLIVGTGAHGALPVAPEVSAAARRRGIELVALPTPKACALLKEVGTEEVFAVIHVTC